MAVRLTKVSTSVNYHGVAAGVFAFFCKDFNKTTLIALLAALPPRNAPIMIQLVTLLCLVTSIVSAADVVGIPRSLRAAYIGTEFTCLDKSHTIPISAVNDDFCDCADGSDEPGTSACAKGRFYCVQKGFRGKYVSSAVVGDGVCDCCDGADEAAAAVAGSRPLGAAPCKNTCDVDGASWRAAQAATIEKSKEGALARAVRAEAYKSTAVTRTDAVTKAAALKATATEVKLAADRVELKAKAEQDAVNAAAAPQQPAAGDSAVVEEVSLGITGLDRGSLLSLLIAHVRETQTGKVLAQAIKTMIGNGEVKGERERLGVVYRFTCLMVMCCH